MGTFRCDVCEAFNQVDPHAAEARCTACESSLDLSGMPQGVDAPALERAIALSPVPLFVDFWAPWCGPCLISGPMVEALGSRLAGAIVVLEVNGDDDDAAGEAHAIYAVPTFAVFVHGEEVARRTGVWPRDEMERWVRGVLAPTPVEARAKAS
jgi:thioredoxin 2